MLYGRGGLGQGPGRMKLGGLRGFKKESDQNRFASILAASCSLVGLEETRQEVLVRVLIHNES